MSLVETMMIRLHPVSGLGGNELLRMECTERPSLDLHYKPIDESLSKTQKQNVISLGKNTLTMIADPTLPRSVVDVIVERSNDESTSDNDDTDSSGLRDTIRMLADPSTFSFELPTQPSTAGTDQDQQQQPKLQLRIQRYIAGFVAINNETVTIPNAIIKEGDILSLQSMSYSYDYVVILQPIVEASTTTATTKMNAHTMQQQLNQPLSISPSDNDTMSVQPPTNIVTDARYVELVDQQQKLMQQMVSDEFTCAICLDYQVRSTALVPCGHSFCSTCIIDATTKKLKHKVCSVCNTKITAHIPNRTIDSCFQLIVQFQSEQQLKLKSESEEDDDDETSSALVSILPQEDLEHFKERSEEQTNIRMKKEPSARRRKRSRLPTNNDADERPPHIAPFQFQEINAADLVRAGLGQIDAFDAILARHHMEIRHMQPSVANITPRFAARMNGATLTDAIEID